MDESYINSKDLEKNQKIILDSGLFDENFYLKKYKDINESKMDPLWHWLNCGYEEPRMPNSTFDNYFYNDMYLSQETKPWNTLTHFIKIGSKKGYKTNVFENSIIEYDSFKINNFSKVLSKKISIFLLIFEFSNNLKDCIESLFKYTKLSFELTLLSYKKIPQKYFDFFKKFNENIIIKENNKNDFLEFINENVQSTENDVVVINSNTFVSPKWLTKLILKAYSEDNIGIVFPLSNTNLNIFPHYKNSNGTLEFEKDGFNDLFNKFSLNLNCNSKYLEGFCFFIKNSALSDFKVLRKNIIFDKNHNKFLISNIFKSDLRCVVDDTTYVYNDIEFFSSENKVLLDLDNQNVLKEDSSKQNVIPKVIYDNVKLILDKCDKKKLFNRILFILDENEYKLIHDFLFNPILKNYDCYFLINSYDNISLWKNSKRIKVWDIFPQEFILTDNIYKTIYFNVLNSYKIELVQLTGLKFNSLDIVDICKLMRIPLVFYSDDLHYIRQIEDIQVKNQKNFSQNYIKKLGEFFDYADVFLSNEIIKEEFDKVLPPFSKDIKILNNSFIYDLENRLLRFNLNNIIKILIPHDIDEELMSILLKVQKDDNFSNIEFHVFGGNLPNFNQKIISHNVSNLSELKNLINEIKPEFLFMTHIFKDIFDVLDLSYIKKIPIFVKYMKLLVNVIDQQKGVIFINTNSSEELFKSMKRGFYFNGYSDILRNMFNSDIYYKKNVDLFNQNLMECYTKYQKDSKLAPLSSSISRSNLERKPDFSNFEDFLAHSYTSPFIKAPFLEEEKRCFAVMDNITKYLINKVKNSKIKPLVSVIMPVFNRETVVLDAINSVLNQTYDNWELIIVDDCSTDGTRKLLNDFNNDKIKVIFHEVNSGSSSARNTALNEANGEIIMYLDSDNEWDSRYVETMVGAFMELPDADALYSAQLIYNNSEEPVAMRYASFNKSLLHNANYIDMNSFCHKRHIINSIGKFDEDLIRLVDWDFILRISNNFKIYSVPVLLSKYYVTRADNRITDYTRSYISLSNSNVSYVMKVREKNKFKVNFNKSLTKPVSIVIPSFESLSDLRECINSIINLRYGELVKIIVVDNNSNEAVKLYLKHLKDEGIIDLILNDVNYGFTYAVNQGIAISNPDSDILLMNNDSILTENALESMQYVAYNFEDSGLVVPQQVLPDGSPSIKTHVPYANKIFECDVNPSKHHKNITNVPMFHDGEVLELNFAPFFCVYIKRDILNNSFGLDAELGRHYRSDRIFSDYVRHVMGLKIYHTSNAVVYHKLLRSTKKLKENKEKYDLIYLKNQWEDDLSKKLGFKKAIWDY